MEFNKGHKIQQTRFVGRQWEKKFAGTCMNGIWQEDFLKHVNKVYGDLFSELQPSHNEFCKYFYFENPYPAVKRAVIKIDHTIYPYIQSGYSSRTAEELAVLSRWVSFPVGSFELPTAEYIGLVLYSRDQLLKEHNEMFPPEDYVGDAPWTDKGMTGMRQPEFELTEEAEYGIVAVMGLSRPEMDPMPPITHLRNALGGAEGGNGVPINKLEYNKSVEFWKDHILVK
jgi:hypothetical protein